MKKIFRYVLLFSVSLCFAVFTSCASPTSPSESDTVAKPTISLASGTYYASFNFVTVSCTTSDVSIYYTTDGSDPTTSSTKYNDFIILKSSGTLKVLATKSDKMNSSIASATYELKHLSYGTTSAGLPCYSLDGTRTLLPLPTSATNGYTRTWAVTTNGDIYIFGATYISGSSPVYKPCYWKNGNYSALSLPFNTVSGFTMYAAYTHGSDVYTAGYVCNSAGLRTPCYWKNGECISLPIPSTATQGIVDEGMTITASGDVYATGYVLISSKEMPCYWKNGIYTALNVPVLTYGSAKCVTVNGTDLYITGNLYQSSSSTTIPAYWCNGTYVALSAPAVSGCAGYETRNSYIYGNDVYIAGFSKADNYSAGWMKPVFWKNGTITSISLPASDENGGIWWFSKVGNTVVPCGSWSSSTASADFYYYNGTYYSGPVFANN